MNHRQIEFRKLLISQSLLNKNINPKEFLSKISEFSKTDEFIKAFELWEKNKGAKYFRGKTIKSIKEILNEIIVNK